MPLIAPLMKEKEKLVVIGVIAHCFLAMIICYMLVYMNLEPLKYSALLVISPQRCFMKDKDFPMDNLNDTIPKINDMISKFHTVVYVSDIHPRKHVTFASGYKGNTTTKLVYNKHNGKLCRAEGWSEQVEETTCYKDTTNLTINLVPDHCINDTDSIKLHPRLFTDDAPNNLFFSMGGNKYMAHKGPFDPSCHQINTTNTTIYSALKHKGLTDVYLTGVFVNNALYHTISQALELGLRPFIVQDVLTSNNPQFLRYVQQGSDIYLAEEFYVTYEKIMDL